mmetsp:Transcript_28409/g.54141  ORF Transcript_28409/g.54141 Transcript_28409/m.54141 type:complete len:630 (+) Transcript_28409:1816-3705(+)
MEGTLLTNVQLTKVEPERLCQTQQVLHEIVHQAVRALVEQRSLQRLQVSDELVLARVCVLLRRQSRHCLDVVPNVHNDRVPARVLQNLLVQLQLLVDQAEVLLQAVLHDGQVQPVGLHGVLAQIGEVLGNALDVHLLKVLHEGGVDGVEGGAVGEARAVLGDALEVLRNDQAALQQRRSLGGLGAHKRVAVAVAPDPGAVLDAAGHVQVHAAQGAAPCVVLLFAQFVVSLRLTHRAVNLRQGVLGEGVHVHGGVKQGVRVVVQPGHHLVNHRRSAVAHLVRAPQRLNLTLNLGFQAAAALLAESRVLQLVELVEDASQGHVHNLAARLGGVGSEHRQILQGVQLLLQFTGGHAGVLELSEGFVEGSHPELLHLPALHLVDAALAHAVLGVLLHHVEQRRQQVEHAHHARQQLRVHLGDVAHQLRVQAGLDGAALRLSLETILQVSSHLYHLRPVMLRHHNFHHPGHHRHERLNPLVHLLLLHIQLCLLDSLRLALGIQDDLQLLPHAIPHALGHLTAGVHLNLEHVKSLVICGGDLGIQHSNVHLVQGSSEVVQQSRAVVRSYHNEGVLPLRYIIQYNVCLDLHIARAVSARTLVSRVCRCGSQANTLNLSRVFCSAILKRRCSTLKLY